jgi:hypothetical protein
MRLAVPLSAIMTAAVNRAVVMAYLSQELIGVMRAETKTMIQSTGIVPRLPNSAVLGRFPSFGLA